MHHPPHTIRRLDTSAFELAARMIGRKEIPGKMSDPLILAMLKLDADWPEDDRVAWCSAFPNFVCYLLDLPRSKSLRARSWIRVGIPVLLEDAIIGSDVVVFKRGWGDQPGIEVIKAPGHVGFYAGRDGDFVRSLGGNQSNEINISPFMEKNLLCVRRLY